MGLFFGVFTNPYQGCDHVLEGVYIVVIEYDLLLGFLSDLGKQLF